MRVECGEGEAAFEDPPGEYKDPSRVCLGFLAFAAVAVAHATASGSLR